jgi:hypothetical protein
MCDVKHNFHGMLEPDFHSLLADACAMLVRLAMLIPARTNAARQ